MAKKQKNDIQNCIQKTQHRATLTPKHAGWTPDG